MTVEGLPAGISCLALRSPTLPPATHTNCWLLGLNALTLVDPGSDQPEEINRLIAHLLTLDRPVERVLLTHQHADHTAAAEAIAEHFSVPIVAHPKTATLIPFRTDQLLTDQQHLDCGGLTVIVKHTPGHAPGHIVLWEPRSRSIIAGDLVAGVGTILIGPDGDLQDYLNSLEAVRSLRPLLLMPAHGPVLSKAVSVLSFYIAHRHQRSQQVLDALDTLGASNLAELTPAIYPHLNAALHPLAAIQLQAHLNWLNTNGCVYATTNARWRRNDSGSSRAHTI